MNLFLILFLFLFCFIPNANSYSPFFNHWICVGIKEDIKWEKPYKINIGELPLVLWSDTKNNKIYSALNICKHMGSKLDNGMITGNGCLKCRYHGLEYKEQDQFGEVLEQDGKIFWAYKPKRTRPIQLPFFQNPKYAKSFLTIDMDASLTDSAFNTMDLRHLEFVHGGIGFGSPIPPENIKEFFYNYEKVGLSFDYNANKIIKKINKNTLITKNFHMFYYPTFSWSKVTFGKNNNLIIGVNLLPLSNKKTRWYITLAHNYYTNDLEKQIMKAFATVFLGQDYIQMKNQHMENKLKKYILFNYVFKNEETIIRLKDMFEQYNYPTDEICLEVYKDFKDFS